MEPCGSPEAALTATWLHVVVLGAVRCASIPAATAPPCSSIGFPLPAGRTVRRTRVAARLGPLAEGCPRRSPCRSRGPTRRWCTSCRSRRGDWTADVTTSVAPLPCLHGLPADRRRASNHGGRAVHPWYAHPGCHPDRLIGLVAEGMTTGEILVDFPQLTADDVREALQFAAAAVDQARLPLPASA